MSIPVHVWVVSGWFNGRMGCGVPNPFTTPLEDVARYRQDQQRLLFEHMGDVGLGCKDPKPYYSVPEHDGRLVITTGLGAGLPLWDDQVGSFWPGHCQPVWAGISTPAEVERIQVPDWSKNPLLLENASQWEIYRRKVGADCAVATPLSWAEMAWTNSATGRAYKFNTLPSFLDLGAFLMGPVEFMTVLGSDPELSRALLRKCFEISASLSAAICRLYGRPRAGWASMGGDNSCLVSPDAYREYAMAFDALARAQWGNVPRNLHSCGASKHLYGVWAEYPEKDQIVLLQTRAIPGAMRSLRQALPHTFMQLSIHQPQVDFERETPARIKELVWELAAALEFRDLSLCAIISDTHAQCKANVHALYEAVNEVRDRAVA